MCRVKDANIPEYLMKAIKLVISRYRNRETMLFANNRGDNT